MLLQKKIGHLWYKYGNKEKIVIKFLKYRDLVKGYRLMEEGFHCFGFHCFNLKISCYCSLPSPITNQVSSAFLLLKIALTYWLVGQKPVQSEPIPCPHITKTSPCNENPLIPYFYIFKFIYSTSVGEERANLSAVVYL